MKNAFLLIFLAASSGLSAQNLTGTWLGYGGGTDYIKMVITHRGDSLFGYTYDEGDGYCKATFKGRFDKERMRLTGRGIEMIENTPNHVLVTYDLHFESYKGTDYLRELRGNSFFDRFFDEGQPQVLKRVSRKTDEARPKKSPPVATATPKPPAPKPNPKPSTRPAPKTAAPKPVPKPEPKINSTVTSATPKIILPSPVNPEVKIIRPTTPKSSERPSRLAGALTTTADSITVTLYDNGEVDGDTVSVFFNNMMVLERFRISEKGKSIILPLANGVNTIEMFAHNLGNIPPNTALLVITSGSERHELRTSADLKTNARIDIRKTE